MMNYLHNRTRELIMNYVKISSGLTSYNLNTKGKWASIVGIPTLVWLTLGKGALAGGGVLALHMYTHICIDMHM